MKADRETLLALLAAYLEEFAGGPGGYDRHTFVDWCATAVIDTDKERHALGTTGLIDFYQNRIASLRALWADSVLMLPRSGGCRSVVPDNYGEFVEVWDCAPGEERIDVGPEGRARSFEVPTAFRAERFSWTADGRELILRLREEQRKGALQDETGPITRKVASRKTPNR